MGGAARERLAELVDPAHAAVVVVDMQNDFCSPEGKLAESGGDISMIREILPRVARFVGEARRRAVRVVHIQTLHAPDSSTVSPAFLRLLRVTNPKAPFGIAGTWGGEIVPEVRPAPGEPVVTKLRSGAFTNTNLHALLQGLGVRTTIVVGEQTPGCIEATVRQAADLDYWPVVVTDCVGAFDRALHEAAMTVMAARWDTAGAEEIVRAWDGARSRS